LAKAVRALLHGKRRPSAGALVAQHAVPRVRRG
jgi:hypothetical protein